MTADPIQPAAARRRRLPSFVMARTQTDGKVRYRSWAPMGASGAKKWTKWVETPEAALLRREEMMKAAGELPERTLTLGEAIKRVEGRLGRTRRPDSLRFFKGHAKQLALFFGERKLLAEFTVRDVERFRDDKENGKLSPQTIRSRRQVLNQIFNEHEDQAPNGNPVRRVKHWPRVEAKPFDAFTAAQVQDIVARIRASKEPTAAADADLVALLFLSGLRRAEAARLRCEDVDLEGGTIWVHGKNRDERAPLAPESIDVLRRMVERAGGAGPLVPVGVERIADVFQFWRAKLGLKKFSPHMLRHSFVSALAASGADQFAVQKLARHATAQMTARYYHGHGREKAMLAALTLTKKPEPAAPAPASAKAKPAKKRKPRVQGKARKAIVAPLRIVS